MGDLIVQPFGSFLVLCVQIQFVCLPMQLRLCVLQSRSGFHTHELNRASQNYWLDLILALLPRKIGWQGKGRALIPILLRMARNS